MDTFQILPGDVLLIGSDGRDDISISNGTDGTRVINENENLFLGVVEISDADLNRIYENLLKQGEITDDLSLLRLEYIGSPIHKKSLSNVEKKLIHTSRELQKQGNNQKAIDVLEQANMLNNVNDAAGALINTGLTGLSVLPMGIEVAPGIRNAVNASRESGILSPGYYNTAINDLKEIKDISKSFLNKPEFINSTEKKVLDAVRRTGSLVNKGAYNDEKLLQKVLEDANQLSDSHFENITGFSKSDIKQRVEELKNITSKKQKRIITTALQW